jgi:hypothetical protein
MQIMASILIVPDTEAARRRHEVGMRKALAQLVAVWLLAAPAAQAEQAALLDAFAEESRTAVKAFADRLKAELQAAIKSGGVVSAIPVCSVKAPEIADEVSDELGLAIGRTSHRVRNPANAPDAWESSVLEDFLARAAAGEDMDTLEVVAVAERDGEDQLRYMKAIPVQQVCLACHGTDFAPEVQEQITAFYPEDRATGFALGELRGAFTVRKPLPPQGQ